MVTLQVDMEATAAIAALRLALTGATPQSFMSWHVAPILCGMLRTYLHGDPDAEARLRSFLAPTERFSVDARLWAPHVRVKAFLRKWFLLDRYKIPKKQPLLTRKELNQVFQLPPQANDADRRKREILKRGDDTSKWTLEDLLEAGGSCVAGHSALNAYCEHYGVFEFFTADYVDALASLLDGKILEVGAGDGMLTQHLRDRGLNVVATDDKSWRIPSTVEELSCRAALQKYEPSHVLASWMPDGDDWTKDMRATPSVQKIVLIGDTEATGHQWHTWGRGDGTPDYMRDGFDMHQVNLGPQLCRYDSALRNPNSSTVVFTRR